MTSLLNQFNTSFGNAQAAKARSKEESNVIQADTNAKNADNSYKAAYKAWEKNKQNVERLTASVNRLREENDRQVAKYRQTGDDKSAEDMVRIRKQLTQTEQELAKAEEELATSSTKASTAWNEKMAAKERLKKAENEYAAVLEKAKQDQLAVEQQTYQQKLQAIADEAQKNEDIARSKIALNEAIKKETAAREAAAQAVELEKGFAAYRDKLTQWNNGQDEADGLVMLIKSIQEDLKNNKLTDQQKNELMTQLNTANQKLEEIKKKNPNVNVAVNAGAGGGGGGGGNNPNVPNVQQVLDGNNPASPFQPRNDFNLFNKPKGHDQRKIRSHADWLRKRGFDPDQMLEQLGKDPTEKIANNTDKILQKMDNFKAK